MDVHFDAFDKIKQAVEGKRDTRWNNDKRNYLRGFETRARLGALDLYTRQGLGAANVFPSRVEAMSTFTPGALASAIVRQDFSEPWLRSVCHAALWTSFIPVGDGVRVYRYLVYQLYSSAEAIRIAAKHIYKEQHSDQVPTAKATATHSAATPQS